MGVLSQLKVGEFIQLSDRCWIERREDGLYNEKNQLVEQTPGAVVPKIERELFHPIIHKEILEFVESGAYLLKNEYEMFNRREAHNVPYFTKIHSQLSEVASEIFGEKVRPSYNYLSLYGDTGVCPFHTDRHQCKYTIDYCIYQDEVWPITVDDQEYSLNPNDAICFSGTDSPHFRKQITGKFCWMVFFHFVPLSFNGSLD